MIKDLSFLKVSLEEQKVIQDREHLLVSRFYEANKNVPAINLSDYRLIPNLNYLNDTVLNELKKYEKILSELYEKRRNQMLIEIQNQLKNIEKLNYKFIDSDIETVSKICLKDFGIMNNNPFLDNYYDSSKERLMSGGFKSFLVYDLSGYNNNLSFRHRAKLDEPDDIVSLNSLDFYNKDKIFKITTALNEIYFMLRHFEEAH